MNISSDNPEEDKALPEDVKEAEAPQETSDDRKIRVFTESENEPAEMSEQAEMMMSDIGGPKIYKIGDKVTGTVVQVKDDNLIVSIGTKNEGIVPREELSFVPNPSTEQYAPGQELDMIVIRQADDDTYFLSKKRAEEEKAWKKVEEAYASKSRIMAVGNQVVNAGLILDMGIRGFLPMSHADIKRINIEDLVGKEFEVRVLEFDKETRPQRLVVSRRLCLEEDLTKERNQIYEDFNVGDVITGKVEKLTGFGAFINLGGVTGLLHISQMSRKRISDPSEVVKVGEDIEVKIIDIDREKLKIRLSRRDLLPDPWDEADKTYRAGDIVEGAVVRVTSFGAFIKIDNYFEGLAHISELVDNKINHAKEVFSPGDKVSVMILEIDKKRKRIRLSAKKAVEKEARREVDAYLKTQGDISNTLKIPLEGLSIVEPETEEPAQAEEKTETETPVEAPPVEETPVQAEPVLEGADPTPEPTPEPVLEDPPEVAETTEPEEAPIEEPVAAEVPEPTPEPEPEAPVEVAETSEPEEAPIEEPVVAPEPEPAPVETITIPVKEEVPEPQPEAEASTDANPEPAVQELTAIPKTDEPIPSQEHSVDEEKDLISGDEFDDSGQASVQPHSPRGEGDDIDLIEGNEFEEK